MTRRSTQGRFTHLAPRGGDGQPRTVGAPRIRDCKWCGSPVEYLDDADVVTPRGLHQWGRCTHVKGDCPREPARYRVLLRVIPLDRLDLTSR
jgi:hypothetical protein